MLILSNFELPALPYVVPITAISDHQNIDYTMCTKSSDDQVYEGSLSYEEGSPLTLCNHFIQHY